MRNTYQDLIEQTYSFPQTNFAIGQTGLTFNKIPLNDLLQKYGSPLKLTYLPSIQKQIKRARAFFNQAIAKCAYEEEYVFTYCTKSSHFKHILDKVIEEEAHLELSSAVDTALVLKLVANGSIRKDKYIICNGYKNAAYIDGIAKLFDLGFTNVIPVLDSEEELELYENLDVEKLNIGLRMAIEEEPSFLLYTSRFGIRKERIVDFYQNKIKDNPKFTLRMLHSFVYIGIQDTTYYWNELYRFIKMYVQLKQACPSLDMINIGGGLPIKNSLDFKYDYKYMCN